MMLQRYTWMYSVLAVKVIAVFSQPDDLGDWNGVDRNRQVVTETHVRRHLQTFGANAQNRTRVA